MNTNLREPSAPYDLKQWEKKRREQTNPYQMVNYKRPGHVKILFIFKKTPTAW